MTRDRVSLARLATIVALAAAALPADPARARAAPGWTDVPALVAHATAPVEDRLRACAGEDLPLEVELVATRARGGATRVSMPLPAVGGRGLTREERCLLEAIARVSLPPLPAGLERVALLHVVTAPGAPPPPADPAFDASRDPAAAVAGLLDRARRAALAACDRRPRTVRLVLDLRRGATRVWLPAWQFHAPSGDGTT